MANMHEIKLRIKSIKETRQITKAMKLISAAKLKRARQMLEQTLPFFNKVKLTMADILAHSSSISSPFFDQRQGKAVRKKGYFIMTGDKGLSGGYNHNIARFAEEKLTDPENSALFIAGVMGRIYFNKRNYNIVSDFDYPVQNPTVYRAREIAEMAVEKFMRGELDEIHLIYTNMETTIKLVPHAVKLLPLDLESLRQELGVEGQAEERDDLLVYEPSAAAVFDVLVPKYVKGFIYGALVEAFTSEQSARMTAMDNATSNADEILQQLNLNYNRARQSAITQEISEIIGGAAALK